MTDNAKLSPEQLYDNCIKAFKDIYAGTFADIARRQDIYVEARLELLAHIATLERERDEAQEQITANNLAMNLAVEHFKKRAEAAEASLAAAKIYGDTQKARADHNQQACVTLQNYLDLYAKTDELVAKDRETFGHLREALMKAEERAEKAEASLAEWQNQVDVMNAANLQYRDEVDSLKASLAQAQKERDELGRWKTEKARICKELGLPEKVCLGEMITSLGEIQAQARREGMEAAREVALEMRFRSTIALEIAAAIRRTAEAGQTAKSITKDGA